MQAIEAIELVIRTPDMKTAFEGQKGKFSN